MDDAGLIRIVDAAMAEATRRSGAWLVCRPGCTECCLGPFPITALDARRLQRGFAELEATDPERARRVRSRALEYVESDDAPCPALDTESGLCDLYAARPMTCRTFGPPARCGDGDLSVCELCFNGASDEEIAACEVDPDPNGIEEALLRELGAAETTVAQALR